ncbi:hypothetical protein H9Q69_005441 [Fusarium xylarioides]|nr:hypothetical protein H9Q69_005441 [Fusarium xylarioides]KAG5803053.1 hypothetical protein H9Q71_012363 [Fusarium xylarioides]
MHNSDAAQTELSSDRPSWLVYFEERIEEERDELFSEAPYYEIVRDLLLAPNDDDKAVGEAITKFYDLYAARVRNEKKDPPEYGAGHKLNTISIVAFEAVVKVWYTSTEHQKLADFLIGIKKGAAEEFDEENLRFVYIGWGLEAAAQEQWNAGYVDTWTAKNSDEPENVWAGAWLSASALIAKLFQGGCLENDGHHWITKDLERTFEISTKGDIKTDSGRQCQVLSAINYILLAGETFVKGAKSPLPKWKFELNTTKWKLWASKIKEVADTVEDTARWDLKERAKQAYKKMVELYPEAFPSDENTEDQRSS